MRHPWLHLLSVPVIALVAGCVSAEPAEVPAPPAASAAEAKPAGEPAAPAPAEAALTVEQLLDKMETARKALKTFRADVVKVRRVEALDDTEKYAGTIQFKTPRLLRLELKSAQDGKETIYFVGKTYVWSYEPQKKKATRGKLRDLEDRSKSANPLEYGLARDIHGLTDAYTLKILPREVINGSETLPLELTPIGGTDYSHGRLIFWIDTKTWLPAQIREFRSNDEIVETHTFSKIETNVRIADSVFEFTPPKDVEENLVDAQ